MPKPTAANLAAFALLALHASSLLTIPPLAVNVVVTATAIVYLGCRKGLKLLPGAKAKAAKGKSGAAGDGHALGDGGLAVPALRFLGIVRHVRASSRCWARRC